MCIRVFPSPREMFGFAPCSRRRLIIVWLRCVEHDVSGVTFQLGFLPSPRVGDASLTSAPLEMRDLTVLIN